MKITPKIISLLLAVIMLCGSLTGLSVLTVSATDSATSSRASTTTGSGSAGEEGEEDRLDYMTQLFASPDEKLATMEQMYKKGNHVIYADKRSGEVAIQDTTTGQVMFTNPYDVAAANSTDNIKSQIMSQIVVTYQDATSDKESVFYSYEQAAMNDQIKVKNIRGGIRVEYTIGREQARRLVPRWIEQNRFETLILANMLAYYDNNENNFYYGQFKNFYQLKSLDNCVSEEMREDMKRTYPCTESMNIYVIDPTTNPTEFARMEEQIKSACPDYSFEDLDYDHQLTGCEVPDENPPVFKMALEYTLNEDGFSVRLPANGIRFNQTLYRLENIQVLPFMGAGNNTYTGYTFYPDGSGALFAFEDLLDEDTYTVSGKMYGTDYAYHNLTGGAYQQDVYYPVFGLVENTRYYDVQNPDATTTRISGAIYDQVEVARQENNVESPIYQKYGSVLASAIKTEKVEEDRGYLAIIEEGDALAQLTYSHDGVLSPYDTVKMSFTPRPKDSYNLADSISVGASGEWTVVSSRKYVGSYRIRYIMLTDKDLAAKNEAADAKVYEAKWMGMAAAYRDYLSDRGVLTALYDGVADAELKDIPLYIETFGATETIEKILSVPVNVDKALTSFEDVKTMYVELLSSQVTNVNFKLTGYYNGGLYASMPYRLKWEKVVSEDTDFQELLDFAANIKAGNYEDLLAYAKEILDDAKYQALEAYVKDPANKAGMAASLGIFPDFEFSYSNEDEWFDGLDLRKHAVKTIDDRYTSKRMYSATQQKYVGYYQLAISPAYYSHFYEELMSNYKEYDNVTGISVGSLGNALNSDFDEDEPYNREDSKSFIARSLEYFKDNDLEVMVDGGNAYTWKFVDHILNAPLDSSRYILASYSVPFLGVVLHGYVNFAGTPLNMEGNVAYATLKAIENGAALYFTLSYQNTQILKEDELFNRYYSIRYDIWREDVMEIYNELNHDLKDVQNDIIINHEFLAGTRVPDSDELLSDIESAYGDILADQAAKDKFEEQMKTEAVADARDKIASLPEVTARFIQTCLTYYGGIGGAANQFFTSQNNFQTRMTEYLESQAVYEDLADRCAALSAIENPSDEEVAELDRLSRLLIAATADKKIRGDRVITSMTSVLKSVRTIETGYENLLKLRDDALAGKLLIQSTQGLPASVMADVETYLAEAEALMKEQLGLTFDQTIEKLALDTFLRTHIANLLLNSYGEDNGDVIGVIGRAENLYRLLYTGAYGVTDADVELFRTMKANRTMTDEEIISKYGLTAEPSMTALLQAAKEMLGDKYAFDPLLTPEQIEANLIAYFVFILEEQIDELSTSSLVPVLNFGQTVDASTQGSLLTQVDNAINAALISGKTSLFAGFENTTQYAPDYDYSLSKNFTEEQMNLLVEDICVLLTGVDYDATADMAKDIRARAEALYYKKVISKIYAPAKDDVELQIAKTTHTTEDSLKLLYSMKSIDYVNAPYNDNTATSNDQLKQAYVAMLSDAAAFAGIDRLASVDALALYGDLFSKEMLELGYARLLAVEMLGQHSVYQLVFDVQAAIDAVKALDDKSVKNDLKDAMSNVTSAYNAAANKADYTAMLREVKVLKNTTNYKTNASDETKSVVDALEAALVNAEMKTQEAAQAVKDAIIGSPLLMPSEMQNVIGIVNKIVKGTAVSNSVTNYVYHVYYQYLANMYMPRFYYDAEMIEMDQAVQAKAQAKAEEIRAGLSKNATAYDVYEALLSAMADENDAITVFATTVANNLDHYPVTGTLSLYPDVLNHYCYVLYHAFDNELSTADVTSVPFLKSGKTYQNAVDIMNEQISSRVNELTRTARIEAIGSFTDYSLGFLLSKKELVALVEEIFTYLVDNSYIDDTVVTDDSMTDEEKAAAKAAKLQELKDEFMPALTVAFRNAYYAAVRMEIKADQRDNFDVSQVYATPEGEDIGFRQLAAELKEMMFYYAMTFTDLSVEDLGNALVEEEVKEEATEGEQYLSDEEKYLSDDGRIVAVIYGDDADGNGVYEANKTFILNYNKFSVRVNYVVNGETVLYTIPAYGYVVVSHDHGN